VALADKIILLFKSGYAEAIMPMQITILATLFIFINFPIGALLNACDRQKNNTINMIIITIISVAMNLMLIPHFKAVGASTTVLVTSIIMTILGLYWAKKIIKIDQPKILIAFGKIFIASALMALLAYYLKARLNIIFVVPVAAVFYLGLILLFRTIKKDEYFHIIHSFLKKKSV
jgi:stage V sporulation protein B